MNITMVLAGCTHAIRGGACGKHSTGRAEYSCIPLHQIDHVQLFIEAIVGSTVAARQRIWNLGPMIDQ